MTSVCEDTHPALMFLVLMHLTVSFLDQCSGATEPPGPLNP